MYKLSLIKIKKFLGEENFQSVYALMELCRKNHPKGMHTNAGCSCGSSVGGGIECEGLGVLIYNIQRIAWMEQELQNVGIFGDRLEDQIKALIEKNEKLENDVCELLEGEK